MSNHSSSARAFFIFKVFYQYIIVKEKRQEIIGKKKTAATRRGKRAEPATDQRRFTLAACPLDKWTWASPGLTPERQQEVYRNIALYGKKERIKGYVPESRSIWFLMNDRNMNHNMSSRGCRETWRPPKVLKMWVCLALRIVSLINFDTMGGRTDGTQK